MRSGKRQITERIELSNQDNLKRSEKGKLLVFGNIGSGQQSNKGR